MIKHYFMLILPFIVVLSLMMYWLHTPNQLDNLKIQPIVSISLQSTYETFDVSDTLSDTVPHKISSKHITIHKPKRLIYLSREFIKQVEGFKPIKYQDANNQTAIGYGFSDYHKDIITPAEAAQVLTTSLININQWIDTKIEVKLNTYQRVALLSFVYNVGKTAFIQSTLLKELNTGRYGKISSELKRWIYITKGNKKIKSPGLQKRRQQEIHYWNS